MPGVVAHTFNTSTPEAKAVISVSSRPVSSMGVLGQLGLWSLQKDGPGLKVPEFGGLGWEKNVDFLFIKDLETPIDTLLSMALSKHPPRPAPPRPCPHILLALVFV